MQRLHYVPDKEDGGAVLAGYAIHRVTMVCMVSPALSRVLMPCRVKSRATITHGPIPSIIADSELLSLATIRYLGEHGRCWLCSTTCPIQLQDRPHAEKRASPVLLNDTFIFTNWSVALFMITFRESKRLIPSYVALECHQAVIFPWPSARTVKGAPDHVFTVCLSGIRASILSVHCAVNASVPLGSAAYACMSMPSSYAQ